MKREAIDPRWLVTSCETPENLARISSRARAAWLSVWARSRSSSAAAAMEWARARSSLSPITPCTFCSVSWISP